MMDWDKIERDVNSHTQALALSGTGAYHAGDRFRSSVNIRALVGTTELNPSVSGFGEVNRSNSNVGGGGGMGTGSVSNALTLPLPTPPTPSSLPAASASASSDLPSAVMRELAELRQITQQQAKRLSLMEKMFNSYSDSMETMNNQQFSYNERLDMLEHEHRVSTNAAAHAARERAELSIQSKSMIGRQQALEEAIRGQENDYASKESFAQLLDTTVDQIRSLTTLSESSRQRSTQSIMLTEALIQALYELNSGPSGFRLDFLTSLSSGSGDHQREQIVRLLIDALHQAISVSVRNQFSPAIECMANLFRPQIDSMKRQHEEIAEELKGRVTSIQTGLQARVDRTAETTMRLEKSIHECVKSTLDCMSDLHKLKEIHAATVAGIQSVRETQVAQRSALDALTATQNNRHTHEIDRAAIKENIRILSSSVDALSESVHSARLDFDAKVAELMRAQDRLRGHDTDQSRKTERLEGQLKGDLGTIGVAQQSLQQQFDNLARDFASRTLELDHSFTELGREIDLLKRESRTSKTLGAAAEDGAPKNVSPRSPIKNSVDGFVSDEAQAAINSLSQSLVTLTMDVDDLKAQGVEFKAAFKAIDDDFGRLTQRTTASVAAAKDGTDALQQELVALSDAVSAVQPTLNSQDAKIYVLRQEVLRLSAASNTPLTKDKDKGTTTSSSTTTLQSFTAVRAAAAVTSPSSKKTVFARASFTDHTQASASKLLPHSALASASTSTSSKTISAVAGPSLSTVDTSASTAKRRAFLLNDSSPTIKAPSTAPTSAIKSKTAATQPSAALSSTSKSPSAKTTTPTARQSKSSVRSGAIGEDSGSDLEPSFLNDSDEEKGKGKILKSQAVTSDQVEPFEDDEFDEDDEKYPLGAAVAAAAKVQDEKVLDDSFSESDDDDILGRAMLSPEQKLRGEERQRTLQTLVPLESKFSSSSTFSVFGTGPSAVPGPDPGSVVQAALTTGSLLGGAGRSSSSGAGVSGIRGTAQGERKPVYASELVLGKDAASETAAAARRTIEAATALKKETVQCTHCLRRLPKTEVVEHMANCELRTEMCPRGCGASVRFLKMEQHLSSVCSKKI